MSFEIRRCIMHTCAHDMLAGRYSDEYTQNLITSVHTDKWRHKIKLSHSNTPGKIVPVWSPLRQLYILRIISKVSTIQTPFKLVWICLLAMQPPR